MCVFAFIKWVLVSCKSHLAVDITDDDTSPTGDPAPNPPSPCITEHEPEPAADGESKSNVTAEPLLSGATELRIALEPEPIMSNQEHEGAKDSPTRCTSAEGELKPELGLQDGELDLIDFHAEIYADMPPLLVPSTELPPPFLPSPIFLASAPPPLSHGSPSAHPQPTICAVGSPRVCHSPSASWLEDPSSPPPASKSWTPSSPSSSLVSASGFHLHLLVHRQSAPWSRQYFLHHGFSLRRFRHGPPSFLRPGSCLAPPAMGPFCFHPGSLGSSSWDSNSGHP
ncbi:Calcium-transporting ATPase type 2C member 1 [Labeo rohita]|uniref:Calcium-transporting ATPase type 2C member 1 n=1 Tax=Labeo rohita TaxID=84645 RepID=A0ABQ8LAJ5_LABRO|nr:Calcium-transporting ATPase type 2C member 1 [Labeo rohita]